MTNREVLKEYITENFVIEEVLGYLLLEYKELIRQGKVEVNSVSFVKKFLQEESLVYVDLAEQSKIKNMEKNIVDGELKFKVLD